MPIVMKISKNRVVDLSFSNATGKKKKKQILKIKLFISKEDEEEEIK